MCADTFELAELGIKPGRLRQNRMFLFCDPDQDFPGDAEQIKWNSLDRQGGCFGD